MDGSETSHTISNVEVKTGEMIKVEHNFASGIANIGVSENGKLVDCTVKIYDAKSDKLVAGKRSYTSAKTNPRPYVLNAGEYKIKLRGRKNGKDMTKEFSIRVEVGGEITKMYEW